MTREIYDAMRNCVRVADYETSKASYEEKGWSVSPKAVFYLFDATRLNEGIDDPCDDEWVESIIQPMTTRNMWNVCQRFYSFISGCKDIDERLLNLNHLKK